jgi:serine/threonine protein phosphatase 1
MRQLGSFFRWERSQRRVGDISLPQIPAGERVYAIGDIHGRADLLRQILLQIDADVSMNHVKRRQIVFLGDYVDRGPDTRGVLETIRGLDNLNDVVLLAGNHEVFMLEALEDVSALSSWLWAGGRETLLSYDIRVPLTVTAQDLTETLEEAHKKIPVADMAFLRGLKTYHTVGDYAFVHAGVRPGIPLDQQSKRDFLLIREDFIRFNGSHSHVIVHGHTPVEEPDIRTNRINIDTGAYITGTLTCLVLEGTSQRFL